MKRWLATLQHFKMLLLYRLIQTVSYKTIFSLQGAPESLRLPSL